MQEIKLSSESLRQLYENIGQDGGLEKILIRFYEKMAQDVVIGFYFEQKDLRHIALQQKAFLLRAWGLTSSYSGKSPAQAHAALPPILKGHFDRRLTLLSETLTEFQIDPVYMSLWVRFENQFRASVQSTK